MKYDAFKKLACRRSSGTHKYLKSHRELTCSSCQHKGSVDGLCPFYLWSVNVDCIPLHGRCPHDPKHFPLNIVPIAPPPASLYCLNYVNDRKPETLRSELPEASMLLLLSIPVCKYCLDQARSVFRETRAALPG